MATPYFQYRFESVPSTQDVASDKLTDLPVLVIAAAQSEGRGRTGSQWVSAPAAFAVSFAFNQRPADTRPISLIAGVAATRMFEGLQLKWPNDVLKGEAKIGGILVERGGEKTVVGFGLNLFWPSPPPGVDALFDEAPPENRHAELAALWGAELARLLTEGGWPHDEYREACATLGQQISWDPGGSGRALDVAEDGGLVVETAEGVETIRSGTVSRVRG